MMSEKKQITCYAAAQVTNIAIESFLECLKKVGTELTDDQVINIRKDARQIMRDFFENEYVIHGC